MLKAGWKRRQPIFWMVIIGFAVTMQWPMVKGLYYRATGAQGTASDIKWGTSLDAALAAAREQKRLVLADFGAAWCAPCVAMEHETWPSKDVSSAVMQSYVPLKIDVDKSGDVAERFDVSGIPSLLLLDANGRVLRRAEGYLPPSEVLKFLKGQ